MAIYQNNWQLTDFTKPEYQIKVDITLQDGGASSAVSAARPANAESYVLSERVLNDGATVTVIDQELLKQEQQRLED
jgi:hypothetical protein